MQTSTGGFHPTEAAEHIRDSALCGTCHTLITETLGSGGKGFGSFPEQKTHLGWLDRDYPNKRNFQSCHMAEVQQAGAGNPGFWGARPGGALHRFFSAHFFF